MATFLATNTCFSLTCLLIAQPSNDYTQCISDLRKTAKEMYFLLILKWLEVRFLQEQMLIIHGKYENKAISTFSFVH